jgi:hypothetical protein
MGQEEASEPAYTTHVNGPGAARAEQHLHSTAILIRRLPDSLPIHDTLLTDHINDGSANEGILRAVTDPTSTSAMQNRVIAGGLVGTRHPADRSFHPWYSTRVGPHGYQRFKTSADGQPGCAAQGRHG